MQNIKKLYKYSIFNETFEVDFKLEGLDASSSVSQFSILEDEELHHSKKITPWSSLNHNEGRIEFRNFISTQASGKIIYYRFLQDDLETYKKQIKLLHQPLGYLMFQQNKFVIHGSSFSFNNHGVVLAGLSGSGKSETVNFISKTHPLISDDLSVVEEKENATYLIPGIPFICAKNHKSEMKLNDARDRSLILVKNNRARHDTKIKKIFFLEWGEKNSIEKISKTDAFRKMLPNSYRPLPSNLSPESERFYFTRVMNILNSTTQFIFHRKLGDIKQSSKYLLKYLDA